MSAKTLYVLVAAAVIALLAAFWISNANQPASEGSAPDRLLLPHLKDQLNDVDSITLTGAGDKVLVTLKRGADGWRIAEKSGYPADLAKLREFLFKLADATVLEEKTANPKLYADLGVDDVAGKDAKGVQVTIGGLQQPLKFILGLYNGAGGGGTFARRDGEAQSLLASGNLLAEKSPAGWLKRDLVNIDSSRIKEVVLTNLEGKVLRVAKDQSADVNFKVADVPKGREVASDYVANSLGSGLANLGIDDVAAAHDLAPPDKVYKVHYLAFGGTVVDLTAWDANGKNAVQLAASNDAAQLDANITAEQAAAKAAYETAVAAAKLKVVEAKGDAAAIAKAEAGVAKPPSMVDPAKDHAERVAAADKVVEDLNKTFAGWTFTVPAYAFASFNKSMNDMLKPIAQKTAAGGRTPALQPAGQPSRGPAVKPAPSPAAGH
ncbi:MAG: DUF4340 domain-containing protein [Rudaea sp.]